jgi:hypothetical protein
MFTSRSLVDVFVSGLSENAKPVARQGRKATDLPETAGLPEKVARLLFFMFFDQLLKAAPKAAAPGKQCNISRT